MKEQLPAYLKRLPFPTALPALSVRVRSGRACCAGTVGPGLSWGRSARGRMDGRMDGRMHAGTDGWMEPLSCGHGQRGVLCSCRHRF